MAYKRFPSTTGKRHNRVSKWSLPDAEMRFRTTALKRDGSGLLGYTLLL